MAVQLTTETRLEAGSCNFCKRGVSNATQTAQVFPYTHVAVLGSDLAQGTGSMRLCPECLDELRRQLATYELPATRPEEYEAAVAANSEPVAKKAVGKRKSGQEK